MSNFATSTMHNTTMRQKWTVHTTKIDKLVRHVGKQYEYRKLIHYGKIPDMNEERIRMGRTRRKG